MKPAAGERARGCLGVFQVALHHNVAAKHGFRHGEAVALDRAHVFGVAHVKPLERVIANPLA